MGYKLTRQSRVGMGWHTNTEYLLINILLRSTLNYMYKRKKRRYKYFIVHTILLSHELSTLVIEMTCKTL